MQLAKLGYSPILENYRQKNGFGELSVGRVTAQHKGKSIIKTDTQEFDGQLIGNLIFTASSKEDFPAVGDWVAFTPYDENKALIRAIFPRKSILARQAIKGMDRQVIATNIDYGIIIQAVDRDFNVNRLERYLSICYASNVQAIIVLSKIDLIAETSLEALQQSVRERVKEVPIIGISNIHQQSLKTLSELMEAGATYCLLGSSGVGKSSLTNNLLGQPIMDTGEISSSNNKGKHVTTHRELFVLENGAILIDNPGMKLVGMAEVGGGIESTFDTITRLRDACKFNDCSHEHEVGCAILHAIETEELSEAAYHNFLRMERENKRFDQKALQKEKAQKRGMTQTKKYSKKDRKKNKRMSRRDWK